MEPGTPIIAGCVLSPGRFRRSRLNRLHEFGHFPREWMGPEHFSRWGDGLAVCLRPYDRLAKALPHWVPDDVPVFVTFRLAGSLPRHVFASQGRQAGATRGLSCCRSPIGPCHFWASLAQGQACCRNAGRSSAIWSLSQAMVRATFLCDHAQSRPRDLDATGMHVTHSAMAQGSDRQTCETSVMSDR